MGKMHLPNEEMEIFIDKIRGDLNIAKITLSELSGDLSGRVTNLNGSEKLTYLADEISASVAEITGLNMLIRYYDQSKEEMIDNAEDNQISHLWFEKVSVHNARLASLGQNIDSDGTRTMAKYLHKYHNARFDYNLKHESNPAGPKL